MKMKILKLERPTIMPFTRAERDLIESLKDDKLFEILTYNFRQELRIPKDGFILPIKNVAGVKAVNLKELDKIASTMCEVYNLPRYWVPTFSLFLLFNFVVKVKENLFYEPITTKHINGKIVIEINEQVTIKKLKSAVGSLKAKIKELPARPRKLSKNAELRKEVTHIISSLRNSISPKAYKKIADIFNEKYLGQKMPIDVTDESVLREYASRETKRLHKNIDKNKLDLLSLVMGAQKINEVLKK